MTKQNMHIHSKYSWDSKMEIDEIARILSENGIRYGAITDHIDFEKEPLPYVLTKFKIRNLDIDRINEQYQGKVILLKGAEISEPHLYKNEVAQLEELKLDFLMGSIHDIDKTATTELEKFRAAYKYYRELLTMVEANQIDVVGHLDYFNRYYGKDYSSHYQISEILNAIKEKKQIIEINTSARRRLGTTTFPSVTKICNYKTIGQDNVIIGTDAHQYHELADNLEQAEKIVNEINLKPVIYQKRKRIII